MSSNHVLREMSRLNGGVDALVEKGLVQKDWQYVKNLVGAMSAEANAQDKTECEQVVDDTDNVGSSVSVGASAAACAEACKNQASCLGKLAKEHVRLMSSFSRSQTQLRVSGWQ